MLICILGASYPYTLLICIPNEPCGWIITEIFSQFIPSSYLCMERWIWINGMKVVWVAWAVHGVFSAAIGGTLLGYFSVMFINSTTIMVNVMRWVIVNIRKKPCLIIVLNCLHSDYACRRNTTPERIFIFSRVYMNHAVYCKRFNACFSELLAVSHFQIVIIIICLSYAIIRFYVTNILLVIPLLFVVVEVGILELFVLRFVVNLRESSISCINAFRNAITSGSQVFSFLRLVWNANPPLDIRFGFFVVESREFVLHLFGQIIIDKIISLLVTF